jgi:hypothetical protein
MRVGARRKDARCDLAERAADKFLPIHFRQKRPGRRRPRSEGYKDDGISLALSMVTRRPLKVNRRRRFDGAGCWTFHSAFWASDGAGLFGKEAALRLRQHTASDAVVVLVEANSPELIGSVAFYAQLQAA